MSSRTDPACGQAHRRVRLTTAADVDTAVAAARAAARSWAGTSVTARSRIVLDVRRLLVDHEDEPAVVISAEHRRSVGTAPFDVPIMVLLWWHPVAIACGDTDVPVVGSAPPPTCRSARQDRRPCAHRAQGRNAGGGARAHRPEHPTGTGTAVSTSSGEVARTLQPEVQVAMIGIDMPVPAPMASTPPEARRTPLSRDHHLHGRQGVRFCTEAKVVTARWPHASEDSLAQLNFSTTP